MLLKMCRGFIIFETSNRFSERKRSPMDSDKEEEVLVCGICQEILLGKVGGPDTLLDHMVVQHSRAMSPENFTETTLSVAQDTGYPNKCLMTQTTKTDTSEEDEPTDDRPMSPDSSGSPDPRSPTPLDDPGYKIYVARSTCSDEETEFWIVDEYGRPKAVYGSTDASETAKLVDAAEAWIDRVSGETVLDLIYKGDPSHPSIGIVNPLQEKAASAAGALLNTPEGLSQLPIPNTLKKLVGCWHHHIYRHRYSAEALTMGPRGCTICCKKKDCQACCWDDESPQPEAQPDSE